MINLLHIEDDELLVLGAKDIFDNLNGFNYKNIRQKPTALQYLSRNHQDIDIIVLDYKLIKGTGAQLLKDLKSKYNISLNMPIIANSSEYFYNEELIRLGATIIKPKTFLMNDRCIQEILKLISNNEKTSSEVFINHNPKEDL
jgi:DNA-binding NarL/FixJ family response regulator